MSENWEVGNMVFQCYVGKMVIGNVAVENTVVGKKLRYRYNHETVITVNIYVVNLSFGNIKLDLNYFVITVN